MSRFALTGRALTAAFGVVAIVAVVDAQNALAGRDPPFRNIRVDVSPLRANAGDPTAAWVQQELPAQLAQALAGRMAANGGTLVVRVDYLTLGPSTGGLGPAGSSYDNIQGVAMIDGVQAPIRATTSYYPSPVDQTMIEQSNHDRVSQLTQALADWISQDPDL